MTEHEIVLEMIEHYRTHPRSTGSFSACRYIGPNGTRCAFSRCCTEDSVFREGVPVSYQLDAQLKPQYEGHSIHFWEAVQDLHDDPDHWDQNDLGGTDLTAAGLYFVLRTFNLKL